jgi:hypothetical protein
MPCLVQRFASVVSPQRDASTFLWIAQRPCQARHPDAVSIHAGRLMPLPDGTPCAHGQPQCALILMLSARRRSVIQRENPSLQRGLPSSLRSATSVALTKVAYFCISLVFAHFYVCASMKFAFCALQNGGFNGRPSLLGGRPWSSPWSKCLWRNFIILMMIND